MKTNIILVILLMAGITYLIRVLPLILIRREIKNPIIRSFLHYVPYVTLSVMTFPSILSATGSIWSSLFALIVAVALSLKGCKLPIVAAFSCLTVFIVDAIPLIL